MDWRMMIYCENKTPRLEYIAKTFFRFAGIDISVTADENQFSGYNGPKLNYSLKVIPNALHIIPHGLLDESGVRNIEMKMEKWEETFCFFKTGGEIPFDFFASSFWLISRYEEYLPFEQDNHSRYSGKNSFLFKNGLLLHPLIDQWVNKICTLLNLKTDHSIHKTLTIDVDNAFAFAHKGFVRSAGGSFRDILKGDFTSVRDRIKVKSGKQRDPFDTYDYLLQIASEKNANLKFFFLLGDRGKFDTNLSHHTKELRDKIKYLSGNVDCGIHPSYQSFLDRDKVKEEISRLEDILGKEVKLSRQHFLRMLLPESYSVLIDCGITEDHTMGFADEPGYRAGTSRPFFWYDLKKEMETGLRVVPFVMMDATLRRYLGFTPEKSILYSSEIFESVKKQGGNFTLLWHNESVSDYAKWKGWKKVLEAQLNFK